MQQQGTGVLLMVNHNQLIILPNVVGTTHGEPQSVDNFAQCYRNYSCSQLIILPNVIGTILMVNHSQLIT